MSARVRNCAADQLQPSVTVRHRPVRAHLQSGVASHDPDNEVSRGASVSSGVSDEDRSSLLLNTRRPDAVLAAGRTAEMGLRKNQTDVIDGTVGEAGADARRRREGRGWGPFSGGQLSAIIITLAIVIGFPVAAFAVTGSNVFVTDAASGTHAKVNASGQLSVAATGSVTATQAAPSAFYQKTGGGNFGTDGSGHVTLCTPALPSARHSLLHR